MPGHGPSWGPGHERPQCGARPRTWARSGRRARRRAARRSTRSPNDDIDYALHPIGIIVYSHDPPKDIRFTISRDLFKSYPAATFDALPARMTGVIDQWVRKAEGKLKISWPFDQSNTVEYLSSLLAKDLYMWLETYESGRAAPKAKGMQAKQRYAVALASGPYAYHTPTGVEEGSPTADGNCPFQKGGAWARWRSVPERGRYRLRPSTGAAQPAIKKARFARSWALVGLPYRRLANAIAI